MVCHLKQCFLFADKNFDGVPIVIIKQETKENCHCPCKGNNFSDEHSATNSASMILVDSGSFPQPAYTSPAQSAPYPVLAPSSAANRNYVLAPNPPNNFVPYQNVANNYSAPQLMEQAAMPPRFSVPSPMTVDQRNVSAGMLGPSKPILPTPGSSQVSSQLDLSPNQNFQFDQPPSSSLYMPPVTDISYSPTTSNLSSSDYPESIESFLDPINTPTNVETSKACCDNNSILQCVTLGCSTTLESNP